ncbi:LysR substrate-binding domain-containing protein [Aquirhabdus sp.]|uniref:hydrogen peroxide-inducible genes activator n=1 Tax=Aquirhabdus sp. TaxID=2824160 RepID=UPI00396C57DD
MSALPSLRQLSYLVTLAETLHFTEAAKRSFVTQSTLSGGIIELERVLGGALVERSRQTVRLTPLGEQVVERARLMLADAGDLLKLSRELGEPLTGDLHLGVIPTIAPFVLAKLLHAVRTQYPKLNLRIHEAQSQILVQDLENGDLDMVLLALPYPTENLQVTTLQTEPLLLVCHEDDLLAKKNNQRVSQLPLEELLLLEEGHCLREHALSVCSLGDRANLGDLEATSLPTLIEMVAAQLGFTLMPQMAIDSGFLQGYPMLVCQPLIEPPTRTLALLARKSTTQQVELDALAKLVRQLH